MSQRRLPRWVWDLVISLQRDEEEHGKLFVANGDTYIAAAWCPLVVLERIPPEVRDTAAILADLLPPTEDLTSAPGAFPNAPAAESPTSRSSR
jgi:hypothetical protein